MSDGKRDEPNDREERPTESASGGGKNGDDGETVPEELVPSSREVSDKEELSGEAYSSEQSGHTEGGGMKDKDENTAEKNAGMKVLQNEVDSRKKEYQELYDRYVRLVADFDNYKKRMAREKADIMAYGNEELIKEMLGVLDNLERAIKHSESAEGSSVIEGVRLVYRQFLNSLEKFGVKPITISKGERFDPRYHQAVEHLVSNEITPGLIISELLKGYTLRDKLLRPSVVVVAKGDEKRESREGAEKAGVFEIDDSDLDKTS